MKLDHQDIRTKEVLGWDGLHLLNFAQSSCSQKVRILLAEKGLAYHSHEVDLKKLEHTTPWFLGINSRGVVPVLVHDGEVHIESNEILAHIEKSFPSACSWLPETVDELAQAETLMALEDELHAQLRVITMGFLAPRKMMAKSEAELAAYQANGPDDPYRDEQIAWWRQFGANGVSAPDASKAVADFADAFDHLDQRLREHEWLAADRPTIVDISWFISIHRLALAGYPLERHCWLLAYYGALLRRPAFRREIQKASIPMRVAAPLYRFSRRLRGTDLKAFCSAPA